MPSSWKKTFGRSRKDSQDRSSLSPSLTPSGSKSSRFGSLLSVPGTLPPSYEEGDAPTMSDDKESSSCPTCGCSCRSKTLDHSAPTTEMVVWSPTGTPDQTATEAPTKSSVIGSIYMEKVHELIPKLEIAKRNFQSRNDKWQRASGSHAQDGAFAKRKIAQGEVDSQIVVLEEVLSWVAKDGVPLTGVQGLMSVIGVDRDTQTEVNKLWRQMEEKREEAKNP